MKSNYTAVIIKSDKLYAGFIKELPGAHSQGKSKNEIMENLKEAVKMIIESNYRHSIEGYDSVTEEKISVNITTKALRR
ncbi:type II toxin-antitoxin system HicB family antitoxin [candidate division KSB1 bacterium]